MKNETRPSPVLDIIISEYGTKTKLLLRAKKRVEVLQKEKDKAKRAMNQLGYFEGDEEE